MMQGSNEIISENCEVVFGYIPEFNFNSNKASYINLQGTTRKDDFILNFCCSVYAVDVDVCTIVWV